MVNVRGGGFSGQAGAIRHGISRALLQADADFRPVPVSYTHLDVYKRQDEIYLAEEDVSDGSGQNNGGSGTGPGYSAKVGWQRPEMCIRDRSSCC